MTKNKVVRASFYAVLGLIFLSQGCRNLPSEGEKMLQKGEECYRLGTSSNHQSNYEESTTYLKQAEEILESIQPSAVSSQKVMIDGVLYIIRGEHMYDAQGQMVK